MVVLVMVVVVVVGVVVVVVKKTVEKRDKTEIETRDKYGPRTLPKPRGWMHQRLGWL